MQSATALIAEDEATLAEELAETLETLWPDLSICAVAANGPEAVRLFEKHTPDVLFLDIEMPGLSGLEVARRASRKSHVVFVTAYDKYALAAFERGAVDYVMKPVDAARLADTVTRLKERLHTAPASLEDILKTLAERVRPRASTSAGSRRRRAATCVSSPPTTSAISGRTTSARWSSPPARSR